MTAVSGWSLFKWCYGDWSDGADSWRQDLVEHAARTEPGKDPSFGTFSPTSGLTGRHPNGVLLDDLVSYDALKRDSNWFTFAYQSLTDLIPVIERNGFIVMPGTRYGDGDPYGRVFATAGIASVSGHKHGPYKATKGGRWHVFFYDAELPDGTPAMPTCWSAAALKDYKDQDPVKYASQLRNDPKAHNLRALTETQFNDLAVPLKTIPKRIHLSFHFDTAFKHPNRQVDDSETVLVVAGHDEDGKGRIWVLEVLHSNKWRGEHFGQLVVETYQKWTKDGYRVIAFTDEQVPGGKGGAGEGWLRDFFTAKNLIMPPFVTFSRQRGANKDARISEAINYVTRGLVQFNADCPEIMVLRDQLCNHPYSQRKDVADAFADIFNPDFYIGRLPALQKPDPFLPAAFEERLKGHRFWERGILIDDDDEEVWRPALGRSR